MPDFVYVIIGILLLIIVLIIGFSYICYRLTFHVKNKDKILGQEFSLPPGKIYEPFHDVLYKWSEETSLMPYTDVNIKSHDGLNLHGRFYKGKEDAVLEIMFHGYRGNAQRDLCGGIKRALELEHNVLLVDQRASAYSDGNVITFGIKEHLDCFEWVKFVVENIDPNAKIILTGVSMGASTVAMASGLDLPKNVIGILADCGFSSPRKIIMKCIKDLHLPPKLCFPFVKLGGLIFGKFNIDEITPLEALENCKVPIIFFHGENDKFVPAYMSEEMYEVVKSRKKLVMIPNAGHGLSYMVEPNQYISNMHEFFYEYDL